MPSSGQGSGTPSLFWQRSAGESAAGLVAYDAARRTSRGLELAQGRSIDAMKGGPESLASPVAVGSGPLWLRVTVSDGAICRFSFSTDGAMFMDAGAPFTARQGRWVDAKVGLFA